MAKEGPFRWKLCLMFLAALAVSVHPMTAAKLYVTQNDDRVVRYEVGSGPASPTAAELSLPVTFPMGLAFSPAGEMFVTGSLPQGTIQPFSQPQGSTNAKNPITDGSLHNPRWAVFRNGELFVAQPEGIVRCRIDGSAPSCRLALGGLAADLHGIAVTPEGDLFVSGDASNRISWYRFDAEGGLTFKKHITGNGLNGPHDITFSPWGEMFVANGSGNTISRFRFEAGNELPNGQIAGNGLLGPIGLAFSPWEELFVAQIGGGPQPILRFTFDAARQARPNGSFGSRPARDIEFVSGGTVLTSGAVTTFREDSGAVPVDPAISVEDPDDRVSRARVTITNLRDAGAERLAAVTAGTQIQAAWEAPVLTLSGPDTPSHYQAVLRSVTYENTSQTPDGTVRRVEIVANDGGADSNVVARLVNVVSVNDPPVARDDRFEMLGNTLLQVDTQQGDVSIRTTTASGRGLLDNDADPADNDPLRIVGIVGCAATAAPFWCHTANQALVVLQESGTFVYTPKSGDPAPSDSFQYKISDGTDVATATVTLDRRGRVWYVKNNYVSTSQAPAAGISTQPFLTLAEAATASQPGDTIYLFEGDGTARGQNAGILLKEGQRLIGAAVDLTMPFALNGQPGPTLVRPAASDSPIANALGTAVSAVDALPAEIAGLRLLDATGGIRLTTTAAFAGSGTVWIHDNHVNVPTGDRDGIVLLAGGPGSLQAVIRNNSISGANRGFEAQSTAGRLTVDFTGNHLSSQQGTAVALYGAGGSLTVAGLADNVIYGGTAETGIRIRNATFDATPGGSLEPVPGGTTRIGTPDDPVGGAGMVLTEMKGTFQLGRLDVFNETGGGLQVSGVNPEEARVEVSGGVIDARGGPAIGIENAAIGEAGLTFQSVSANGSGGGGAPGIHLRNTGRAGGLRVTGSGTPGSGGTIRNTGTAGIELAGTAAVRLAFLDVSNDQGDGLRGVDTTGLTLSSCRIRSQGVGVQLEAQDTTVIGELSFADSTIEGHPAAVRLTTSGSGKITGFSTPGSTLKGGVSLDLAGAPLPGLTCSVSSPLPGS